MPASTLLVQFRDGEVHGRAGTGDILRREGGGMDLQARRRYYAACRDEALDPDDPRNVDIDGLGTAPARGVRWVNRLAARVELSPDEPVRQFVTGLPGSGKSTELRRLAERLSSPGGADLLVVLVDAEEALDLTQRIDVPDLIAVLVREAEVEVLRAEGRSPDDALKDGFLQRTWHWLTKTDVELGKGDLAVSTPGKLVLELKTRPTLRQRVRATIATHLTTFLHDARDELRRLDARARACGRKGLFIILDSLEKLRGISTNWEDVLQSAEQVFSGGAPYLRLPVHVLYTVPAAMVSRRIDSIEFMPMVKLRERDRAEFGPGYQALRELIRKRIPDGALADLLGAEQMEARVHRIITRSGGYPREVVQMLRWLLELPALPASDLDLERAQNEVRDGFRAVVTREDVPWLIRVGQEQTVMIEDEAHRPIVDRALSNNVVLRYCNTETWYDLHPAVRDIPAIREALDRPAT